MSTNKPHPTLLKDYVPPSWLADEVVLDVRLEAEDTRVIAELTLRPNGGGGIVLDGEKLELHSVALNGRRLDESEYTVDEASLSIPQAPQEACSLRIETSCNPKANTALSGLYLSSGVYCTQCEAEGFRRITYYPDRPDVLARFKVRIEGPKSLTSLLSNGNLVDSGEIEGLSRHFAVWEDPFPKPSYLFALVAGDLAVVKDSFTTMSGREVALRLYVEHGKQDRCGYAIDALKRAMAWDEENYGREYDLDIFMIVAVSDFNMGAMENKGLNVFNDKYILVKPETATDDDFGHVETIVAHEYFHNWTGNRITCRDWFQLCLKEGLTVFRDQQFTADQRSAAVSRIKDVRLLRARQFPEDAGPLAHPVRPQSYIEINNFYTATVYEKGAEVIRMLHTLLGAEGFRKGMDLYFKRHDGQAATVEDFIACFEDACDCDLSQFMHWYDQAGTPELAVSTRYYHHKQSVTISVEQSCPPTPENKDKQPYHIPLRLGLLNENGEDQLEDGLVELRETRSVLRFDGIKSKPIVSLLRGFSAPVNINANLAGRDRSFLMANDSDLFNRWHAAQDYAMGILTGNASAIKTGAKQRKGLLLAKAMKETICDEGLEPAYRALFLALPGQSEIAQDIGQNVDPAAIYEALETLRASIAEDLHEILCRLYQELDSDAPYSPDAGSAGRRSLRNSALSMLAASKSGEAVSRLVSHYRNADNMTDKIAALSGLARLDGPAHDDAFADFFEKWKDDHIVLDKWFGLQAASPLPDTLERVKKLRKHKLFSLRNPNRARALISMFAYQNQVNFHRPDGAGYDFVASCVLDLDAINPQGAAGLATAFRSWRMLEPERRKLAGKALERIVAHEGLSSDVYEIATKSLA